MIKGIVLSVVLGPPIVASVIVIVQVYMVFISKVMQFILLDACLYMFPLKVPLIYVLKLHC